MKYLMRLSQKAILVLGVSVLILLIALSLLLGRQKPERETGQIIQQEQRELREKLPRNPNTLPTIPPSLGSGIDTEAKETQIAIQNIQKLSSKLPFESTKIIQGRSVRIHIAERTSSDAEWALYAYIDPIEYEVPITDVEFATEQAIFLTAAKDVFSWIESQGVDPQTITISWGGRKFIQERAELWLKGD